MKSLSGTYTKLKSYVRGNPSAVIAFVIGGAVFQGANLMSSVLIAMKNDDTKGLFDGLVGALLGAIASILVIVFSVKGLKREMKHQSEENDRGRERDALAEFIAEVNKLFPLIEANDFKKGSARVRVFDGWHVAVAKLRLQIVEQDDSLFWIIELYAQRIGDQGHAYWRIRKPHEYYTHGIRELTDFLVVNMVDYGRSDLAGRYEVRKSMAKRLSEEYYGELPSDVVRETTLEMKTRLWNYPYQHPPLG